MNEMENQHLDESLAFGVGAIGNSGDPSNCMIASNGRGGAANTVKSRQQQPRRSVIGNRMSVDNSNDAQAATTSAPSQLSSTVSSIAQRPRRQVKHKFIKSANINLVDKSNEQNNARTHDVNEQEQQQPPDSNHMQILSPDCKVRLVPLIHRLPVNSAKLNWNDVISQTSSEQLAISETMVTVSTTTATEASTLTTPFEYCDNVKDGDDIGNVESIDSTDGAGDENGAITSSECEPITSIDKEMKTERHKKLSNSKQAIRRGRQLRQTVCPVEPAECENGTDEIERSAQENNTEYSVLTSGKRHFCYPNISEILSIHVLIVLCFCF